MEREMAGVGNNEKKIVPKSDTHPGTGIKNLDGKVNEVEAQNMLGEDD